MKLYKSILDRVNNPTKEENERFKKLLKKNSDRKKLKRFGNIEKSIIFDKTNNNN